MRIEPPKHHHSIPCNESFRFHLFSGPDCFVSMRSIHLFTTPLVTPLQLLFSLSSSHLWCQRNFLRQNIFLKGKFFSKGIFTGIWPGLSPFQSYLLPKLFELSIVIILTWLGLLSSSDLRSRLMFIIILLHSCPGHLTLPMTVASIIYLGSERQTWIT